MNPKNSIPRVGTLPPPAVSGRRCRGFTLAEVQVAFVLLGIGLAGLCPLVVMQLRQARQLELRLQGRVSSHGVTMVMPTAPTYYIVPWQNPWTRKLAGGAQIVDSTSIPCDPGPLSSGGNNPSNAVSVLELDAPAYGQSVSLYVDVTPL
jgi:type II secretory pathway pseudopilin PulG